MNPENIAIGLQQWSGSGVIGKTAEPSLHKKADEALHHLRQVSILLAELQHALFGIARNDDAGVENEPTTEPLERLLSRISSDAANLVGELRGIVAKI